MDLTQQLAVERRRRLEAERLLTQREGELRAANARLSKSSVSLKGALDDSLAESIAVRDKAEKLETDFSTAQSELARATHAAAEAEERLWAALQTIRDGFALFDVDRRLVVANNAYIALFDGLEDVRPGIRFEDIAKLMLSEGIVDPEGPPGTWLARVTGRWAQEPIPSMSIRLWNGQFIKLVDRRTPDGGIVSLAIDQTDMMRIWAAIETVPDGFVLFDQDDRLVICNQRFRELYSDTGSVIRPGITFEEVLRYGLSLGVYPDAKGREDLWLEDAMARHRTSHVMTGEQQFGDHGWLRVVGGPTPDDGRVILLVDINTLKQQQAALERERERAEAANRAKSAFLANMSHEIRTPMNGVVGMADLLHDTGLTEDQRLYANTIKSSGEALLVILNDILDYSKIEAGRMVLHPAPFDLESLLHDIVVLMQPRARQKALELIVDFDLFLPTEFVADSGRLKQVMTNLVGNAVKFTHRGHVLIRVTGYRDGTDPKRFHVHITVEDTGIGIASDKIEHVFGKFNQVEETQNRSFEGTGLGLAISRELIELMGGRIWVDSELGVGSSFGISLTMPLAPGAIDEIPTVAPSGLSRAVIIKRDSVARAVLMKQLSALGLEVLAPDPAAPPPASGFGPGDVALIGAALPGDLVEGWVRVLRAAGVSRFLLVSPSAGRLSKPHPGGIETVIGQPIRRAALSAILLDDGSRPDPEPRSDDRPAGPLQGPAADAPSARAGSALARLRVLAAEDNRTNRLVFERFLADQEVDIQFATNGLEAVRLFEASDPPVDVVFMDISMPEMDGKEATRRIREIEARRGLAHTPVIAMTAHALTGDAEEILHAGLDDYLTKPLAKEAVIQRLADLRNRLARAAAVPQAAG